MAISERPIPDPLAKFYWCVGTTIALCREQHRTLPEAICRCILALEARDGDG